MNTELSQLVQDLRTATEHQDARRMNALLEDAADRSLITPETIGYLSGSAKAIYNSTRAQGASYVADALAVIDRIN